MSKSRKEKQSVRKMLELAYNSGAICSPSLPDTQSSRNALSMFRRREGLSEDDVFGRATKYDYRAFFGKRIDAMQDKIDETIKEKWDE